MVNYIRAVDKMQEKIYKLCKIKIYKLTCQRELDIIKIRKRSDIYV
mgnify:FL=1